MTVDQPSTRPSEDDVRVVCLLPVRNGAEALPAWLESVAQFADAVVALDDGSTDGTGGLLRANPLVEILLEHPQRESFLGWNDSLNRNRLLDAAAALSPDWIISIDADQLVPAEDADALRAFVEQQAVPGIAYGFPVYRMIGDVEHYDILETISYRLFAYRPGQRFPDDLLHFDAVPTSIPRGRWLMTNIRFQHLHGLTRDGRLARRQKYREVDPHKRWAQNYDEMVGPVGEIKRWASRRDRAPVLLESRFIEWRAGEGDDTFDPEWPVLSVVVIVSDETLDDMMDVVAAIDGHASRHPFEVLVVAEDADVADDVARSRPGTSVVVMPPWSRPAACRSAGLRISRGEYVLVLDAPSTFAEGALDEIVDAHDRGVAAVSGETVNLTRSAAGWASFFDGVEYSSFARTPLLDAGGFDDLTAPGWASRARQRLAERGHLTARVGSITFAHQLPGRTSADYLRDRLAQGRAATLLGTGGPRRTEPVERELRKLRALSRYPAPSPDVAECRRRVRALRCAGIVAFCAGALARARRAAT